MHGDATGENPSYSAYIGRFGELTKRILGGLFVLIAVGALGVIVAGAVAEGDQLFVRFLTAVVVAALGLYVVSDLRLQASKSSAQTAGTANRGIFDSDETSDYLLDLSESVADDRELESVGASYGASGSVGYDLAELEELRESLNDLESDGDIFSSPTVSNNDDLVALVEDGPNQSDTIDQFAWPNLSSELEATAEAVEQPKEAGEIPPTPQDDLAVAIAPEPTVEPPVVVEDEELVAATESIEVDTVDGESMTEVNDVEVVANEQLAIDESSEDKAEPNLVDLTPEPVTATPEVVDLREVIDLREGENHEFDASLEEAIQLGEETVVNTLMDQGMLSQEGEITDRDVRTMVYVAFTSNELRKLIKAGGVPGGENPELDLGPVELFDESAHSPAPKVLYQASSTGTQSLPEITTES